MSIIRDGGDAKTLLRVLQLLQDGGVFQGGDILRDFIPFCQHAQQPAHDLAGTGFGQVVAKADFLWFGNRADFLGNPIAQFLGDLFGRERFSTTKAQMDSPVVSSGLPTTAASATMELATSADSISIVPSRWPDMFSTSSMRPVMVK
jgi:hypothetical protein